MKWYNKLTIIMMIVFIVSNPLTGQYLLQAIDWTFQQIFIYGAYVSAVAATWLVGYIAWVIYRQEQVKIPKKAKKTTSKFIET